MMEYEFTDPQGNRFCFRKGFGPKVYHPENLCSGTPYSAELILNRFDDQVIDSGFDHFYFDVLSRLPNYSPQRRITMARALADNHLILEKLKSLPEVVPDNRSILRVQIRNALRSIVEDEKREAAMHQRQMDKESTLMKGLIYTGAFMTGIGSSAWGLAVQAKEISDVINPFVKMQHHATALRTAWESDDFADTYTETYLSGEKRELVEAIGFDPSQITQQQIDEAIAMADLVLNDDSLRDILYGFVKDYAEAQHAIEITRVAGSGAFELILTIIVAAVTGGAGVVAAVDSKMHLLRKFKGVGEHLVEFAKASRSIKKAKKESQGQNTGPGKFESEAGSARQTNPHGAETGSYTPVPDTTPRTGDIVHKRLHPDGSQPTENDKYGDPYTIQRNGKPLGAKEGIMPLEAEGLDFFPDEYTDLIEKEGFPDVVTYGDYKNFSSIEPFELKEGDKIYRIIDEKARPGGGYWAQELPANKESWRSSYAVKDSWNDNGYFVEHTVGKGGMKGWKGKTAGQQYRTHNGSDFYLQGGEQQLYLDASNVEGLVPKQTHWPD